MNPRSKVIGATALMVIGGGLVVMSLVGGSELQASGVAETGFDLARLLIWGGVGALVISALMFISASAK